MGSVYETPKLLRVMGRKAFNQLGPARKGPRSGKSLAYQAQLGRDPGQESL